MEFYLSCTGSASRASPAARTTPPAHSLPKLNELNEIALKMAKVVNANAKVVGISINTSGMQKEKAVEYLKTVENEMKLPTVDPVLTGTLRLVEQLANFNT